MLDADEKYNSIGAVTDFIHDGDIDEFVQQELTVLAEKNHEPFFSGLLKVVIGKDHNECSVDVIWEDKLPNYKELGLFGSYNTTFNRMKFSGKTLIVEGTSGVIVKIVGN